MAAAVVVVEEEEEEEEGGVVADVGLVDFDDGAAVDAAVALGVVKLRPSRRQGWDG